jgi:hypothetical protein
MSLRELTSTELLELRTRITSGALKAYQRASEYTRAQAALPELSTPGLAARWLELKALNAISIAAGQEAFELLGDIAAEYQRRAIESGQSLEGMTTEDAVRYIEDGHADA